MSDQQDFGSRTYGEAKIPGGQVVEFCCRWKEAEAVRGFLQENVYSIDIPTTGQVNVPHGGYGVYTRYNVTQHEYAGGGGGYIEVLEIVNPPDNRCGFVIHEYRSYQGRVFTEWKTVEEACAAWEQGCGGGETGEIFATLPGYKRRVPCGYLRPWFYAVGDELLMGDYAFPEGLQDDPVYRVGDRFVVYDENDKPMIKTCMGTRARKVKREHYPYREYLSRIVYWHDGTLWSDDSSIFYSRCRQPRPLRHDELWVDEAMAQFEKLLTGASDTFVIPFTNGRKFVGRIVEDKSHKHCAAGTYSLSVTLGSGKVVTGAQEFVPTAEDPDIVTYVTKRFAEHHKTVERIEVVKFTKDRGGQEWGGVFFKYGDPSSATAAAS